MPPRYNIGPFWSSNRNTDVQINVFVSDKHFQIDILTANLEKSPSLLEEYAISNVRTQDSYPMNQKMHSPTPSKKFTSGP
jgi:hypothetical protein